MNDLSVWFSAMKISCKAIVDFAYHLCCKRKYRVYSEVNEMLEYPKKEIALLKTGNPRLPKKISRKQ